MRNRFGINAVMVTALLVSGGSAVGAVAPISEIPLEEGIVIDTTTGTTETVDTNADTNATVETTQGNNGNTTEEAKANDGTTLPLDQGEVNSAEVDTGTGAVEVAPAPTSPQEDTVVLAQEETKPKVEPLPKTGIADNAMVYTGIALLVGLAGLMFTRFSKSKEA